MKPFYSRCAGLLFASAYFLHSAFTPNDWHFVDNVNLIFHEAGHTIFSFFGEFIHVLMGSGFQILLPAFIACYFFYTRQRFAGAITLLWVGQNFINVSVYARDALAMRLPLLGGDGTMHDWHYLLVNTGLLNYTPLVASILAVIGFVVIILGMILGVAFMREEND